MSSIVKWQHEKVCDSYCGSHSWKCSFHCWCVYPQLMGECAVSSTAPSPSIITNQQLNGNRVSPSCTCSQRTIVHFSIESHCVHRHCHGTLTQITTTTGRKRRLSLPILLWLWHCFLAQRCVTIVRISHVPIPYPHSQPDWCNEY